MGFKESLTLMLKFCIDNSLVRFGDTPMMRLNDGEDNELYFINVTDTFGENIVYSFDKFMEIINSKGLDGFTF